MSGCPFSTGCAPQQPPQRWKVADLLPRGGFLSVGPQNVGFAALKVAEDSADVVLRIFETDGQATTARLEQGWEVAEVPEPLYLLNGEYPLAK